VKILLFKLVVAIALSLNTARLSAQQPSKTIPVRYKDATFDTVHCYYQNDMSANPRIGMSLVNGLLGYPTFNQEASILGINFTHVCVSPDLSSMVINADFGSPYFTNDVLHQLGFTYESHQPRKVSSFIKYGPLELSSQVGGPNGAVFSGQIIQILMTMKRVRSRYWGLKRDMILMAGNPVYHSVLLGLSQSRIGTTSTFQVRTHGFVRSFELLKYKLGVLLPVYYYSASPEDARQLLPIPGGTFEVSLLSSTILHKPFNTALRNIESKFLVSAGATLHPVLIDSKPVLTIDFGIGCRLWNISRDKFGRDSKAMGRILHRLKSRSIEQLF
jgi:hypothetical protein